MVKKKGQKANKPSIAASLMETFIEDGYYPELKQSEGKLKKLSSSIREQLKSSEVKRHEFTKHGLVGRFIAKKVYETDYLALNEYLYDVGLLLQVVEIDNKAIKSNFLYYDMIQEFKLEDTFFVKPNFNKVGKELNKLPDSFVISDDCAIDDLASQIVMLKPRVKELKNDYERLKWKLINLPEFEQMMYLPKEKREPIPHKYGSISLVANQPRYNVPAVYDYIGEWLLIEYGKPNSELLERFILNGTISKKEIDQFKTVKTIDLEFSVMTLEDEEKFLNMLDNKNRTAAANRMGA